MFIRCHVGCIFTASLLSWSLRQCYRNPCSAKANRICPATTKIPENRQPAPITSAADILSSLLMQARYHSLLVSYLCGHLKAPARQPCPILDQSLGLSMVRLTAGWILGMVGTAARLR
ncbi:hypothetical protein CC79DRAFT_185569 [Sarocladium strictum]